MLSRFLAASPAIIGLLLMFLAPVIGLQSRKKNTRQCPSPEGEILFRKPATDRIALVMLCLGFLSVPLLLLCDTSQPTRNIKGSDWAALVGIFAIVLGFDAVLFKLAGPEELRLFVRDHTYQRVSGWPLFPSVSTGSWNDMSGVYVRPIGRYSNSSYLVGISWKGRRGKTDIGRFDRKAQALSVAERLQTEFGLRRVVPPPYGNPLDDAVGSHRWNTRLDD